MERLEARLAIQPLLDESKLGSASIADFIVATNEMYDDSMIKDANNCLDSIFPRILVKPMIGAHWHCLDLAATN